MEYGTKYHNCLVQEEQRYNKDRWPVGIWSKEPDRIQWPSCSKEDRTQMECLILRDYVTGELHGYVGVSTWHRLVKAQGALEEAVQGIGEVLDPMIRCNSTELWDVSPLRGAKHPKKWVKLSTDATQALQPRLATAQDRKYRGVHAIADALEQLAKNMQDTRPICTVLDFKSLSDEEAPVHVFRDLPAFKYN